MRSYALRHLLPILACAAIVAGCDSTPLSGFQELEQTVEQLSEDKAQNRARIEELEKKLRDAEMKIFWLGFSSNPYKSATFDPAAIEGFGRLDTSVGSFAVSIQDVSAHADGVKVRLHVGNLTSATISGGTFKVKWGSRMPKAPTTNFTTAYTAWQGTLKEKDVNFTTELRPGTWNKITLTLPGVSPEQFGHLNLSLEMSQIKLYTSK